MLRINEKGLIVQVVTTPEPYCGRCGGVLDGRGRCLGLCR